MPPRCRMPLTCWLLWVRSGLCCRYAWARRRRSSWLMDWGKKIRLSEHSDDCTTTIARSFYRLHMHSHVIFLCSQWHHEQQGFLPTSQPDESAGNARDCHGGHGQRAGRRQVTGTKSVTLLELPVLTVVCRTHLSPRSTYDQQSS